MINVIGSFPGAIAPASSPLKMVLGGRIAYMRVYEEKLKAIAESLAKGVVPQTETVRSFLLWFRVQRRAYGNVRRVRIHLKRHGLVTVPDFEAAWLDASINFKLATSDSEIEANATLNDPIQRIGRLDAANRVPVSVKPDSSLTEAITIMLTNDFSQLPVMTGSRDVKGAISWKTIGSRLALKRPTNYVRECMENAHVVSSDRSIFDVISLIASHDYVLVQAKDKTVCGIVTATDFNLQFLALSEPFLLVGEIEMGVRRMLHGKYTIKELEEAKLEGDSDRQVESPADLTFGEYVRLIEPEKRWKKLKIEIDRVVFLEKLNRVRSIRNDVMHFSPDGLDPDDLIFLREFAQFLTRMRDVGAI